MRKFIIFIGVFFTAVTCYAGLMTVTTGYGYYTWDGQIISKYNFPPGNYSLPDSVTYTEVNSDQMNSIQVNSTAWDAYVNSVHP